MTTLIRKVEKKEEKKDSRVTFLLYGPGWCAPIHREV